MKQGIHPNYHTVNVVMTDGTKYQTRTTWGKEGDTLTLDVDSKSHPAWVGGVQLRKTGQMEKFNNKFAAIAGMNAKSAKEAAPKAEANAEKKAEPKAEKKADKKADKKDA